MLDLPRFAVLAHNVEDDYWTCCATRATFQEANDEYKRMRGKREETVYLVSLGFIAGPGCEPIDSTR